MRIVPYPNCCGIYCLTQFNYGPKNEWVGDSAKKMKAVVEEALPDYISRHAQTTGFLLAAVNETQNTVLEPLFLKLGFEKMVGDVPNWNHAGRTKITLWHYKWKKVAKKKTKKENVLHPDAVAVPL